MAALFTFKWLSMCELNAEAFVDIDEVEVIDCKFQHERVNV